LQNKLNVAFAAELLISVRRILQRAHNFISKVTEIKNLGDAVFLKKGKNESPPHPKVRPQPKLGDLDLIELAKCSLEELN
jgi:hypothetical protein